jgi:hypothetical protein
LAKKKKVLDGIDKQYLHMFGISLKYIEDQPALADDTGKHQKDWSVTTDDVVFVHCCCGHGSFLSKLSTTRG